MLFRSDDRAVGHAGGLADRHRDLRAVFYVDGVERMERFYLGDPRLLHCADRVQRAVGQAPVPVRVGIRADLVGHCRRIYTVVGAQYVDDVFDRRTVASGRCALGQAGAKVNTAEKCRIA